MDAMIQAAGRDAGGTDSNIIWFADECLNNGVRLERYVQSAERGGDLQLADFFRRALRESRRLESLSRPLRQSRRLESTVAARRR
jgi:hypothetical protein